MSGSIYRATESARIVSPMRPSTTLALLILAACATACATASARDPVRAGAREPVIDMHLHAHSLADYGGGMPLCGNAGALEFPGVDPRGGITFASPIVSCAATSMLQPATSDSALMRASLAMLVHEGVIAALTTGTVARVAQWRAASNGRVIPATAFGVGGVTPDSLQALVRDGRVAAFAEVSVQYDGMRLDDPRLEPFFALAERLDVPVGVHLGEGPPGGAYVLGDSTGPSAYRVADGNPLQLEPVLVRHPRLRIWVMHYGSPFVDETIALLYSHPQVFVDIAQNDWGFPRAHFYSQLQRLVNAGFAKRIMFGSDQMIWPDAIPLAIETVRSASFLTEGQKRDILYWNAARFLRLDSATVARHRAMVR